MTTTKKVSLNLVSIDGNAFSIISTFSRQAKKEGWTPDEIKEVVDRAKNGDYDHLLRTFMEVCEPEDDY